MSPSGLLLPTFALLLAACSADDAAPADSAVEPEAWVYDGEAPDAVPTGDELSEAVQALADQALDINAGPVLESYQEAMEHASSQCPGVVDTSSEATGDMTYWDGLCEGRDSVWYKGPMTTWSWEGTDIAAGNVDLISAMMSASESMAGFQMYGAGIRGQTDIYDGSGAIDFNCSCAAMMGHGSSEDGRNAFFSYTDGPAHWTGDASDGTWLAEGVRPGLWIWAAQDPNEGLQNVTVAGNITGFAERFDTARLDLAVFKGIGGDVPCVGGGASSFTLSLRDASTADWWDLDFDVADDGDACIATATGPGGDEVRVDLTGVISWQVSPW